MAVRIAAISAVLLVVAPVQLSAQEAGSDSGAKDPTIVVEGEKEDPSLDKVICKRIRSTGSRLGESKECRTKRQWEAEKAQSRQQIEKAQNYKWNNGN
ncbi:MAG: hypothetical protein R3E14_03365 [Erythrobacter sp.]